MIKKVIQKFSLGEKKENQENLKFWLTKSSEEWIEAVEILRRQYCGNTARLQRVVKIVSQK